KATAKARAKPTPFHQGMIQSRCSRGKQLFSSSGVSAGIAMLTHRQGFFVLDNAFALIEGTPARATKCLIPINSFETGSIY
ncbi:MAG TPA: hypothetical protein VE783_05175, partial [Candidatus Limnocylindrales bacterium]|nr:hypothetical protein [Candidatus Limnocylindrales bacterium]